MKNKFELYRVEIKALVLHKTTSKRRLGAKYIIIYISTNYKIQPFPWL